MSAPESGSDRRGLIFLHAAIALISAAVLLLQIAVTRILSVTLWYHFSFLAISVAMLGLGLGSALAARRSQTSATMPLHAALFALTTPGAVFYVMSLVPPPVSEARLPVLLLTIKLAILVVPFLFAGACIALMLRTQTRHISTLYAWDLVGAAAGALSAVPLLNRLSAPNIVLVAAIAAALGAVALGRGSSAPSERGSPGAWRLPRRALPPAALGICLVLLAGNLLFGWLGIRHSKGDATTPLLERWSALARVTVTQAHERTYRLVLDGCAATAMHQIDGRLEDATFLRSRGSAMAFLLKQSGTAVIVGPGGAEDVVTALTFPRLKVIAAEINPTVIRVVEKDFGDITGHPYDHPRVEVVITDGRNFFTRRPGAYDIIHLSMVDTFAATAAGALALSENNLYTLEAFSTYLDNLAADGILSITWWRHASPVVTGRMIALASGALARAGAERPEAHIVVFAHGRNTARRLTILVKRSPFSSEELRTVRDVISRNGWDLLHPAPEGQRPDPLVAAAVAGPDGLGTLTRNMAARLAPPSDDRPFLFYTHDWSAYFRGSSLGGDNAVLGWVPVFMLATLFWSTLVASAGAVAWPWVARIAWRTTPGLLRYGAFFAGLGLGFLAIEALLIQVFVLYLGHPSYALTCVLFSLLLSAGIGSNWAGRRWGVGQLDGIRWICLAVAAAMVLLLAVRPWAFHQLTGLALGWRLVFAVLILAPLGFLMGMPFQAALRALGASAPHGVPWAWSINAVTSVLGSVFAMLIALHQGFTVAGWLGAGAYAVAALALPAAAARRVASS